MVGTRTIVTASAAVAIVGYLIYFDYKRRNDSEFRKRLRKEKKKAAKINKEMEPTGPTSGSAQEELKEILAKINLEPLPNEPQMREKYFMDHVTLGEQMMLRGPAFEVSAALCFYRALRAFPSPEQALPIFEASLPPHICTLVKELLLLDVSSFGSAPATESSQTKGPVPAPGATSTYVAAPTPASTSATPATAPATGPVSNPAPASTPVAPASTRETESEHDSEVMVDVDAETEAEEVESEAGTESKAEVMSEAEVISEAEVVTGEHSELDAVAKAQGVKLETESTIEADEKAKAEDVSNAGVPPGSRPEDGLEPQPESESAHKHPHGSEQKAELGSSEPVHEPPAGSDVDAEANSDAHSDTDSYHKASQDGHHSESEWDQLSHPSESRASLPPRQSYYVVFPPKKMNVKISNVPMMDKSGKPVENEGIPLLRSTLVTNRSFKAGEVIYKASEKPVVAALDSDLQAQRTHCTHCLQQVDSPQSVLDDPINAIYCSTACEHASKTQSQNVLFGLDPPLPLAPGELQPPRTQADLAVRRKIQEEFIKILRKTGATHPLLVGRFIASMVAEQGAKLSAAASSSSGTPSPAALFDLPEPDSNSNTYSFYDHIERLKYLEIVETPAELEEVNSLKQVLKSALDGLEEFVGERYPLLKGKMAYNAIGVTFSGGRDDKSAPTVRPEDVEHTRTPYGTSRQTGSAFYRVSSYLSHSCAPNVRPDFPAGTSELHLVASEDIPAGTELTMAYVDVRQGPSETRLEARRRRRQELARGWRFACECARCLKEVEEGILNEDKKEGAEGEGSKADDELDIGSGAKLEEAVRRFGVGAPNGQPQVD
ncbi:MAS20 domain-containing protein [Ceratobasidium theobromae]|uniref:MAS20 domain-containing protein n=1 Tax=Ceratobasidium theobromae TaxID=1582974 RepID=A0A5N5QXH9_9AGAM|nr:MAS20 domain-containing protein [Ceratobasidium theobromae]